MLNNNLYFADVNLYILHELAAPRDPIPFFSGRLTRPPGQGINGPTFFPAVKRGRKASQKTLAGEIGRATGPEFQRRRSNRPGNSQAKGPHGDDTLESKPSLPGRAGMGFTEGVSAETIRRQISQVP